MDIWKDAIMYMIIYYGVIECLEYSKDSLMKLSDLPIIRRLPAIFVLKSTTFSCYTYT